MKHSYGEYLFDATSELIKECLAEISEEEVKDCCNYKIFLRGQEYYEDGMVETFDHNKGNNTINATVNGSMEYGVQFYIKDEGVYSTCDCPYDDVCKHTVAALLSIIHEGIDSIKSSDMSGPTIEKSFDFLKKYLNNLSKDDLIQLVMKFAPQNFIKEIHNREVHAKDAKIIIKKAENKIRKFFTNDDLLNDPQGMEDALITEMEYLKGLEKSISVEIGELILFIIRSIDDAFSAGYLYIEDYYQDEYFESEAFCEYVIAFVRQLPFEEKTSYLLQLNQALDEMSYSTFNVIESSYDRLFSEEEKADLKLFIKREKNLSESLVSRLYKTLESSMDENEREASLRIISKEDPEHFKTLCRLVFDQGRFQETFDLIKNEAKGLHQQHDIQVMTFYLESAHKLNLDMEKVSEEVINKCPKSLILQKIKDLKGTVGENCEKTVRQKNPEELLSFYEKENRLQDALSLVKEPDLFYDEVTFVFFKKNWKHFPAETEAYLKNRIEKDLKNTGKTYYERIAESLDLMNRINPERSRKIAEEIRANFKRRTNLIQMIRQY